ncbi:MauE/DoxX family redox-associated membrane protein [Flavobacterium lacisediminis]|uniref:DoxX family protein n=1 Tax=Flavobacterium lacisediminis TaxID=2989705 RepID=A0ABT3EJG5_9FLAO|nr:DoxX family protein [Flavobacterium lacisediminis]MCW1148546.1 DoxX family protein [Flavobacterium lacisediminis]
MKKENLSWILRLIISALFIVSAVAKLYPSPYFAISTFEVKQLYPLGFSEGFAPYFSRILIGIEFALGICILLKDYLKKITIPATILLLAVFTIHLSYTTFVSGNAGNCGCFGELIPMTPVEAIIKNIIAIGLLVWLFKLLPADGKSNFWLLKSVGLGCVLALFMLAPIRPVAEGIEEPTSEIQENIGVIVDSTSLLTNEEPAAAITIDTVKKVEEKKTEDAPKKVKSGYEKYFPGIDTDKKILCYFVPGCDHCMDTAKELNEMRKKDKNFPPIYVIFMNEEPEKIPTFFEFAGTKFPYKMIDVIPFWTELGSGRDTPGVKYLWNGNEFKYYDGINENKFNGTEFKKLIKKPYSELKK